ncbi:MAG: hypothetical protein ACREEM_06610 [Blastocatellia bacterium]
MLNDGSAGIYVVIKTTSKDKYKGRKDGCQSSDRYPNFFIPNGKSFLQGDSWLMLDEFFEFNRQDLLAKRFAGQMNPLGTLPENTLKELLDCAVGCDDISQAQARILVNTRQSLEALLLPQDNPTD